MRRFASDRRQSGLGHPTGTDTTAHDPRDVGTSRRSAGNGVPHSVHTRVLATIPIIPIRTRGARFATSMVRPDAVRGKSRRGSSAGRRGTMAPRTA